MKPQSVLLLFALLLLASLSAAPSHQNFNGVITDSMCATGDHASMRMGPTDPECTLACIREHGAEYVLFDGKHAYTLSDQKTPEKFAAQKVTVTGVLNEKTHTIKVESITPAK